MRRRGWNSESRGRRGWGGGKEEEVQGQVLLEGLGLLLAPVLEGSLVALHHDPVADVVDTIVDETADAGVGLPLVEDGDLSGMRKERKEGKKGRGREEARKTTGG